MRSVIGAVIIENKNILLVRKKNKLILPGGKPENGESDISCLSREIREELSGTKIDLKSVRYFDTFEGISPNSKSSIQLRVYLAGLEGYLGEASSEISERGGFNYSQTLQDNPSEVTRDILTSLYEKHFL